MRFAGKPHHNCGTLEKLKRTEHFFAAGFRRRAVIGFAEHQHQWRFHILNVADGRARHVVLWILKWRRLEPRRLEQSEVRTVPPCGPTGDVALRYSGSKTIRVADHPVRQ